jgi:hypothetical protein
LLFCNIALYYSVLFSLGKHVLRLIFIVEIAQRNMKEGV